MADPPHGHLPGRTPMERIPFAITPIPEQNDRAAAPFPMTYKS